MGSPFEWLRSVARGRGDEDHLPIEAASALSALAHDPAQLVVACRRILEHHPTNGALWWVASQLLASPDPGNAARRCHDVLAGDQTGARLRDAMPFCAEGERVATIGWAAPIAEALDARFDIDVVAVVDPDDHRAASRARNRAELVDAWELVEYNATALLIPVHAASPTNAFVAADASEALLEAPNARVWYVIAAGRLLATRLFDAVVASNRDDDRFTVVDYERASQVVHSLAVDTPSDLASRLDCLVAPELLRPL